MAVADPEQLYTLRDDAPDPSELTGPDGRGPVLLHSLAGFMDAGEAGRLAARHLLAAMDSTVVAEFDTDLLVDHRARRPPMVFDRDHWESYEAHALELHLLHDLTGTPFLLLIGPEPDWRWEAFTRAVAELAEHFGVRLTLTGHGIPMGVPHTRPAAVTPHATRRELLEEAGYRPGEDRIEVPGSASALLELRLGQAGADAAGVAVHVPHYLSRSEYPDAAVTVLEHLSRLSGLIVPDGDLRRCAESAREEIAEQVSGSDQAREVVSALEEQYDAFERGEGRGNLLAEDESELPSADELAAEFEDFLAGREASGEPGRDGGSGNDPGAGR